MNKKKDILDLVLTQLVEKANEDGIITDEEEKIIKQVNIDAMKYAEVLKDAIEDGIITKNEGKTLKGFKNMIMENAEDIANRDGKLSDDEKKLIRKLTTLIARYYKNY